MTSPGGPAPASLDSRPPAGTSRRGAVIVGNDGFAASVLLAVEATWAATWLAVAVHTGPDQQADVPWLALALPGIVAVFVTGGVRRLVPRRYGLRPPGFRARWAWAVGRYGRDVILVAAAVVGVAVGAGCYGWVSLHLSWSVTALHPWSAGGHRGAGRTTLTWVVVGAAWLRGAWLGRQELSLHHATVAVAVSVAAFFVFFVASATQHQGALHTQVSQATVLLLVFFPGAVAVLSLVHERDLERAAYQRAARSAPAPVWLAALGLPMAVVSGLAVLAALLIGPIAPLIGRGLIALTVLLIRLVIDVASWLISLLHVTPHALKTPAPAAKAAKPLLKPGKPQKAPLAGIIALIVVGVAILAGLVVLAVRLLRRWLDRERRPAPESSPAEEDRESVFTWRHLWHQLVAVFRRRLAHPLRRRKAAPEAPGPDSSATATTEDERSVRAAYRALLRDARTAGRGRHRTETPLEWEQRLSPHVPAAVDHLQSLTRRYERVRYHPSPPATEPVDAAVEDSDAVRGVLLAPPDDPDLDAASSARPPEPPGGVMPETGEDAASPPPVSLRDYLGLSGNGETGPPDAP